MIGSLFGLSMRTEFVWGKRMQFMLKVIVVHAYLMELIHENQA
ncbi:hypothetical protein BvCmsKKP067_02978 [Escherichia coli]|nr:hypothetical protein BvCmsHHP007_01163 [Escherichia coli]GDG11682.1 hypothetical protein BvCmsKKP012_00476 [Escherichia coli]GDG86655.1 hypothetical protein BvCmsKKP016_00544 [Escherichia coli]GDH11507.1 hypothetical protein BvCmsKKP003_03608 [Escherichia coli]GDH21231.1 hypothetical protein BvCmsKKP067_02978 [Escherichia coli]